MQNNWMLNIGKWGIDELKKHHRSPKQVVVMMTSHLGAHEGQAVKNKKLPSSK